MIRSYVVVMNGFYNYADEDTMVAIVGGFETATDRYEIDQVLDLCELNAGEDDDAQQANGDDDGYNYNGDDGANGDDNAGNNDDFYNDDAAVYNDDANAQGDDAYAQGDDGGANDDANANQDDYYNGDDANRLLDDAECPEDGVYDFAAYLRLSEGRWLATGWGATADLQMYAHDGSLLGECHLAFDTKTTSPLIIPAYILMTTLTVIGGFVLFYVVYKFTKKETLCNNLCAPSHKELHIDNYRNMDGGGFTDEDHDTDDYFSSGDERPQRQRKMVDKARRFGQGITSRIHTSPAVQQSTPASRTRPSPEKPRITPHNDNYDRDDSGLLA